MNNPKILLLLQIILLLCGAGMLLYGILRGEVPILTTKAANICLECIGIG